MVNELFKILSGMNEHWMSVLSLDSFLIVNDEELAMENDGMIDFWRQIVVIV